MIYSVGHLAGLFLITLYLQDEATVQRLIDINRNTPYYQLYFKAKPHTNFYADGGRLGPVIISLEMANKEDKSSFASWVKLRALVRTKYVCNDLNKDIYSSLLFIPVLSVSLLLIIIIPLLLPTQLVISCLL